jgi:uncharacterized protein
VSGEAISVIGISPGLELAAGFCVFCAAFLGGITGFGYGLVSTPLLLTLGFPLTLVVPTNLALALITRVSIAYRFRKYMLPRRVTGLVVGSIPGLWIGAQLLVGIDQSAIKLVAGLLIMGVTVGLGRSLSAPPRRPIRGGPVAAGFAGGLLGSTTSLNGVAPVLLLAREKTRPRSLIADLALFFVASNAIALVLLWAKGAVVGQTLLSLLAVWLPGSLIGNWIGASIGPRLPERLFRRLTLLIVFVAGGVTALTA